MTSPLSCVEIPATSNPKYSVIWLHGLGADGHDFESIVPELRLNNAAHINFIFPNAPVQAVTINGGMQMRSWYDILEASLDREVAVDDIYQSSALLDQIIQQQIDKGIKAENILLAGFSQGGVIALHTGLRYPQKLAGIMALSTYMPTTEQLKTERATANNEIPVFMAHGTMDPVVYPQIAKDSFNRLQAMNYPISWHEYPMQHSLCIEEITDISAFINRVL
ncbi:phospholipase/carboxylesterase [Bathymodiolus platifrons methanotrophic gill symbiont]|uniref:alpha/beta hydrolase n=1 Tax=Bathymodiolus platifrons methanotrophic gill symbiont TaxID=113268 RepID=UPI000B40F4FB|nr:alpha/beta hydrolase [Bathymodiolus platifrons methanotrophic gill symbiont]MCK5871076.1 alpha/beta hydrolase [Methyloprofundus sp.]TXK95421.1 carboxylesterase [Methylococcaceae bacterium CS5]TXK98264.1 carboxylesterase [Methylococcaceae bacterium CS4]TXL06296.1 carboxylesterase [Methylococcaceae bacterium CS3]TXL07299.1 carboxylesterase [Methylococcaceae bacterium CS1]TXL11166.1 carboxylesterase [Methylococcaceae bacterium CS2]TXL12642.1 carboxylesterase [Methylococcaceae bacterium HT4]